MKTASNDDSSSRAITPAVVQVIPPATIQEFISTFRKGAETLKEACQVLTRLVDGDSRIYDKIVKAEPRITYNMLANMERVGRGVMHFELLMDDSPAARRIAELPVSQQAEAYEKPVSVVKMEGEKIVVEQKPARDLAPSEVKTVFLNKHIATVEEQVAALKTRQTIGTVSKSAQRYEIASDGSVTILARTTFTAAQLADIAEQSAKKAKATLENQMKKNQTKK